MKATLQLGCSLCTCCGCGKHKRVEVERWLSTQESGDSGK